MKRRSVTQWWHDHGMIEPAVYTNAGRIYTYASDGDLLGIIDANKIADLRFVVIQKGKARTVSESEFFFYASLIAKSLSEVTNAR